MELDHRPASSDNPPIALKPCFATSTRIESTIDEVYESIIQGRFVAAPTTRNKEQQSHQAQTRFTKVVMVKTNSRCQQKYFLNNNCILI